MKVGERGLKWMKEDKRGYEEKKTKVEGSW